MFRVVFLEGFLVVLKVFWELLEFARFFSGFKRFSRVC